MPAVRLRAVLVTMALGQAAALGRGYAPAAAHRTPPPTLKSIAGLPPVVILPGFGNADVDYKMPLGQPEDVGLVSVLRRRGFRDVSVLDLPRWEWLRVAGGLADPRFWLGDQRPDSIAYGWYVQRARAAIEAASARAGGQRAIVVAHSAGGWLARAALADGEWISAAGGGGGSGGALIRARDVVAGLVTLGAPHFPPPAGSPPCATRGALAYCAASHPGAHLKDSEGLFYITVAGAAIEGRRPAAAAAAASTQSDGWWATLGGRGGSLGGGVNGAGAGGDQALAAPVGGIPASASVGLDVSDADALYARRGEGSAGRVAFSNYLALSGDGGAMGDGVIPVAVAHLEGATQVRSARTPPPVFVGGCEAHAHPLRYSWAGAKRTHTPSGIRGRVRSARTPPPVSWAGAWPRAGGCGCRMDAVHPAANCPTPNIAAVLQKWHRPAVLHCWDHIVFPDSGPAAAVAADPSVGGSALDLAAPLPLLAATPALPTFFLVQAGPRPLSAPLPLPAGDAGRGAALDQRGGHRTADGTVVRLRGHRRRVAAAHARRTMAGLRGAAWRGIPKGGVGVGGVHHGRPAVDSSLTALRTTNYGIGSANT
eukprot:scaffold5687_cov132-Isochrysis_galbana.AAC.1